MIRKFLFLSMILISVVIMGITDGTVENGSHKKYRKMKWKHLYQDADEAVQQMSNNPERMDEGAKMYKRKCKLCHGRELGGGIGPNLTDEYWIYGGSNTTMAVIIGQGTENGMMGYEDKLTGAEGAAIIAFIQSKKGTNPEGAKAPEGKKE